MCWGPWIGVLIGLESGGGGAIQEDWKVVADFRRRWERGEEGQLVKTNKQKEKGLQATDRL